MKSPLNSDLSPRPWLRPAIALTGIILLLVVSLSWPLFNEWLWPGSGNSAQSALLITATPSPFQPSGTPAPVTPTATLLAESGDPFEAGDADALAGTMVLSMAEQGHAQLFWHRLLGQPFTRLTSGAWDDVDPALSPNGDRIAFASNRSGHWDLYVLDLQSGITAQLSDDAAYDGEPSWSSDGAWLAYEHYDDENLEIYIRPIDGSVDPVLISAHAAQDYAPAWRPGSQEIAFVSMRAGSPQIWLVDLEAEGDARFRPLITTTDAQAAPAWSPDGNWLAWAQQADGAWAIYAKDISDSAAPVQRVGAGTNPQ
jgi:TolB protein